MGVVEITSFEVSKGRESEFRRALIEVLPILVRQHGYIEHEFGVSIERADQFWLIVRWKTLEDHTERFRGSADFEAFVGAFRQFLAEPAAVSHFRQAHYGGGG